MIPADIRLFTWIDVEEVLLRAQQAAKNWPSELVWARAYWDGLTLGIRPDAQGRIESWLFDAFDPRFDKDAKRIELESALLQENHRRYLPVSFEETEEEIAKPGFIPTLARPTVVTPPQPLQPPPLLEKALPPVVAFHSFKGGVGRTLAAMALARAMTAQDETARVLLVDGDLEAPGITWLLQNRFSSGLPIALSDFLALVHGESDPQATESIALTAERLKTLVLDRIYVLPAFRTIEQFAGLEIRPEHLVQSGSDPYIFTKLLACLGQKLGVQAVIVDLRAGLSELAAGLLLDPRVHRILVTTLSAQSLQGTDHLLQLLAKLSPATREQDPLPAIIITKVLRQLRDTQLVVSTIEHLLNKYIDEVVKILPDANVELDVEVFEHQEDFVMLPAEWESVMKLLERHKVVGGMRTLAYGRMSIPTPRPIPNLQDDAQRKSIRRRLADFADELVFAETSNVDKFLTITPLRNLATDFDTRVPLVVVVGAKGSGKTYTFLQIVRRKTWQAFVKEAVGQDIPKEMLVYPVLHSNNLGDAALTSVRTCREWTQEKLGSSVQDIISEAKDYIRSGLAISLHAGQWRDRWLDVIAWSAGYRVKEQGVGRDFIQALREQQRAIVALVDGLEDLFQTIDSQGQEAIALRSLLQDVPEWLGQQPDRPLGLVVFVRQDMVVSAVQQNYAQLLARYSSYALKWNGEEALRLATWVASQASVPVDIDDLHGLDFVQLSDVLVPLWGRKLGSEESKEGRSAEWIIAALSDFKGQIQARDLVRLLSIAAKGSIPDTNWPDRVLAPNEIRKAVGLCGKKKIEEITKENPGLGKILASLQKMPEDAKQVPFTPTPQRINLTPDDLKLLEDNGIILREEDRYYMSEIFRLGLGFRTVGRNRVLRLARQARR